MKRSYTTVFKTYFENAIVFKYPEVVMRHAHFKR